MGQVHDGSHGLIGDVVGLDLIEVIQNLECTLFRALPKRLRAFRGRLPADVKFDRDEANARRGKDLEK